MKCEEPQKPESMTFSLSLAACVAFGYLYPTIGVLVIDCQIDHVVFHKRTYPWGWLIAPIAVLLVSSTYFLFRRSMTSYQRLAAAVGPLSASYVISFPIFRPEIPHMAIAYSGTVWIVLIASWMLLRYWIVEPATDLSKYSNRAALIEHTKEQLDFAADMFRESALELGILKS